MPIHFVASGDPSVVNSSDQIGVLSKFHSYVVGGGGGGGGSVSPPELPLLLHEYKTQASSR